MGSDGRKLLWGGPLSPQEEFNSLVTPFAGDGQSLASWANRGVWGRGNGSPTLGDTLP